MNNEVTVLIKKIIIILDKGMAWLENLMESLLRALLSFLRKGHRVMNKLTAPLLSKIEKIYAASVVKIWIDKVIKLYKKSSVKIYLDKIWIFLDRPELKKYALPLIVFLLIADFSLISYIGEHRKAEIVNTTKMLLSKKASCNWDPVPEASAYHYKVIESSSDKVVKEGNTSATRTYFSPKFGRKYNCTVEPVEICSKP